MGGRFSYGQQGFFEELRALFRRWEFEGDLTHNECLQVVQKALNDWLVDDPGEITLESETDNLFFREEEDEEQGPRQCPRAVEA